MPIGILFIYLFYPRPTTSTHYPRHLATLEITDSYQCNYSLITSATKISSKLLSRKLELIRAHGRQQRQTDPAGDSPFPPGRPCLKRNGGAKSKRNAKNENAALQPLVRRPLSHALTALANSMQGIGLLSHLRGHQRRGDHTVRRI